MASVLLAGHIAPHRPLRRSVGDFTVFRLGAGRYAVTAPGTDLAAGRVIALVSSDGGTLSHFAGAGDRGEIHTVRAEDGSYVDAALDFVFYAVA